MIHCECFCVCCDTQTFVLPDGATGEGLRCPSCSRHLRPQLLRPFGEAEWLACCAPAILIDCLRAEPTERKHRLFACACCRRFWHLLNDRGRDLVELAEDFADGLLTHEELSNAHRLVRLAGIMQGGQESVTSLVAEASGARPWAYSVLHHCVPSPRRSGPEVTWLAALIRDVFGNPFRTLRLDPAWLAWEGGTVRKLAEGIYQDQAFDRLLVLADALEEAGCADEQVLAHCRGGGPHVRGCWLLDLLLGQG
jgi:hypothetical protein